MLRKIAGSFVLAVYASTSTAATAIAADPVTSGASVMAAERAAEQSGGFHPSTMNLPPARRGSLLPSLYVSLAGLNAYDAYATLKGVALGATESNRIIGGASRSPAAMWALKSGVTAGSILASERLWRLGHRARAIGMMVASNILMTAVGARNHQVLSRQP